MGKHKAKNFLQFRAGFSVGSLQRLVAEQDTDLAQYYVGHERYLTRAHDREDPASVFIGPKGVGKSAILQMIRLLEDASGNSDRVIEVAPDDLAFNALVNIKARTPLLESPGENYWLFKSLWDYVLIIAILEKEEKDRSQLERLLHGLLGGNDGREQKQLMKITLSDEGPQRKTMTDKMLALVDEIQLSGGYGDASASATVSLRENQAPRQDLKLLQLINNVAKNLTDRLRHEYYVLIDDLDLHWQGTPLQNAFLGSLFYSMRKLAFSPKIKFVVSLRKNIFRQVDLEERDKFSDLVCEVGWNQSAVREMIEKRLEYCLNLGPSDIWNEALPKDAFETIWANTNGMPREVIRLTVGCIGIAQENQHKKVTEQDLDEAIRRFSLARLDDLASDFQYEYPNLKYVLNRFAGGKPEFDIEYAREISFKVADRSSTFDDSTLGWAEIGIEDPVSFVRILLHVGFLLLKPGRDGIPREPSVDEIEEVDERNWFAIHPMYVRGLELHGTRR